MGNHDAFGPIDEAIRAIGTNALPQILSDLQRREPVLWTILARWSARHPWIRLPFYGEDHYSGPALMALRALGSNAMAILPELVKFLGDQKAESQAGLGLFLVGPAALPVLEKACHNTNGVVRASAAILAAKIKTAPGIGYGFGWFKSPLSSKRALLVGWAFMGSGELKSVESIFADSGDPMLQSDLPISRLSNLSRECARKKVLRLWRCSAEAMLMRFRPPKKC